MLVCPVSCLLRVTVALQFGAPALPSFCCKKVVSRVLSVREHEDTRTATESKGARRSGHSERRTRTRWVLVCLLCARRALSLSRSLRRVPFPSLAVCHASLAGMGRRIKEKNGTWERSSSTVAVSKNHTQTPLFSPVHWLAFLLQLGRPEKMGRSVCYVLSLSVEL